jgi:hypothetical protein
MKGKFIAPINFENARITFKNFEGREGRFNRNGERNFAVIIDDPDLANKLRDDGWNVRIKEAREEGDRPFMTLQVAVSFRSFPNIPPAEIYLYTNKARRKLNEETVGNLDFIEIQNIDMTIRPRFWEDDNGVTHIKAYLKEMHVTQASSPWEDKYAEYEAPEENLPFD